MAEEFKGLGNEALRNVQGVRDTMREVDLAVRDLNKQLRQSGQQAATVSTEFRDLSNSADKFAKLQEQASKSSKTTADAIKEQQKQLNIVRSLNVRIDDLYREASAQTGEAAFNLKQQAQNLANARDNAKILANEYTRLAEDSSKLDKSSQFFTGLQKIISDIPILRKFSTPFEEAAKAARETTIQNANNAGLNERLDKYKQLRTQGKNISEALKETNLTASQVRIGKLPSIKPLTAGFKALGPAIKEAFGPLGLVLIAVEAIQTAVKFFIDAMFTADKRVTDIAKNLSIGKEGARGIYSNILSLKPELNTVYATSENIVNAFNELTQLTDFAVLGTKEQLETQIKLTKELGLSTDEALALQGIFAVNNTEADQGLDIINDQIAAFANENKLLADSSKISKQISATNKLILLNFKANNTELIKTVLQANKLGLSLDQVNKIAGSLLNFEQSIEAELTAELLTGKQLNLDKARQFALTNDMAGLTQEIKNSGVDQLFLNAKTRVEQEAIAKSVGMTADELAQSLAFQKQLSKLSADSAYRDSKSLDDLKQKVMLRSKMKDTAGKEIGYEKALAEIGEGELKDQLEAATIQEQIAEKQAKAADDMLLALGKDGLQATLGTLNESIDKLTMAIYALTAIQLGKTVLDVAKGAKDIFNNFNSANKVAKSLTKETKVLTATMNATGKTVSGAAAQSAVKAGTATASKVTGKNVAKTAAKTGSKLAGKTLLKRIPILGSVVGLGFAIDRAIKGDYAGAAMEAGSAGLGLLDLVAPGLGTGLSLAADAGIAARDISRAGTITPTSIDDTAMATGGIVTGPTRALVGEAGAEAVIPLNKFYAKLDELIAAVNQGQNVTVAVDGENVFSAMGRVPMK